MKIKWFWDKEYELDHIGVQLNPKNQELKPVIEQALLQEKQIEVIQPSNNRRLKITSRDIFIIEAIDHLSKIYTVDDQVFYIKGRLKDFDHLQAVGIFRINNSVLLNLAQVASFKSEQYARLKVYTKNNQNFTVSRHYAKQIREAYKALTK